MSLILVALTFFALLLILANLQRRASIALSIGALAVGLYVLPGPSKIAAPLATILALGLTESLSSIRPR